VTTPAPTPLHRLRLRTEAGLDRLSRWLAVLPPVQFVTYTVLAALAVVMLFYPPRLYLLVGMNPHCFDWNRGFNFVAQCQDPFYPKEEPALRWRLLPALIGHYVLRRNLEMLLMIGPLGVVAVLSYLTVILERHAGRLCSFLGVVLLATTSAILTACDWLGINDPWAWLGVLVVAFSLRRWPLVAACILGPWIDERFILALPLAVLIRCRDKSPRELFKTALLAGLILAPYVLARLIVVAQGGSPDAGFLRGTLTICGRWMPFMPLAWWLGYRVLWAGMVLALAELGRGAIAITLGTLLVVGTLAADLTKSVAVIFPLAVLAVLIVCRRWPRHAPLILTAALGVQLLLPDAHIVDLYVTPVLPLPFVLPHLHHS
jgi:hypothetical protein